MLRRKGGGTMAELEGNGSWIHIPDIMREEWKQIEGCDEDLEVEKIANKCIERPLLNTHTSRATPEQLQFAQAYVIQAK